MLQKGEGVDDCFVLFFLVKFDAVSGDGMAESQVGLGQFALSDVLVLALYQELAEMLSDGSKDLHVELARNALDSDFGVDFRGQSLVLNTELNLVLFDAWKGRLKPADQLL